MAISGDSDDSWPGIKEEEMASPVDEPSAPSNQVIGVDSDSDGLWPDGPEDMNVPQDMAGPSNLNLSSGQDPSTSSKKVIGVDSNSDGSLPDGLEDMDVPQYMAGPFNLNLSSNQDPSASLKKVFEVDSDSDGSWPDGPEDMDVPQYMAGPSNLNLSSGQDPSASLKKVIPVDSNSDGSWSDSPDYMHFPEDMVGPSDLKTSSSQDPSAFSKKEDLCSSSRLKAHFMGMGYSATLVDKVIKEHGQRDENLILEALFGYTDPSPIDRETYSSFNGEEDESPITDDDNDDGADDADEENRSFSPGKKKKFLLDMDFSMEEVETAINELGEGANLNNLIDAIIAAQQLRGSRENNTCRDADDHQIKHEEVNTEELFAELDMTTRLLKSGFSGEEVSSAIQSRGAQTTFKNIATHIFAERRSSPVYQNEGPSHAVPQRSLPRYPSRRTSVPKPVAVKKPADVKKKTECFSNPEKRMTKKVVPDKPPPSKRPMKKLKVEVEEETPYWKRSVDEEPWRNPPNPCSLSEEPFFFYGTVGGFPASTWKKLSIYLYEAEPEYVNSRFFSALIQKEGYIHNLPIENRSRDIPDPPIIQDVLQIWVNWPKWDTRTQLHRATANITNADLEQFEGMLSESQGSPSWVLQDEILRKCEESSLVWMGLNVLRQLEPHQLESVLGYPMQHTEVANLGRSNRLNLLKYSFQIDTLEYYLSGLRHRYPVGIRVLSFYTGLGEQVIALNKLGIHMKCLVSVEPNEEKQRILCRWWNIHNPGGKLVQIQEIESLKIKGLKEQVSRFGGFDIVFSRDAEQSDEVISARGRTFGIDKGFLEFVRLFFLLRALMSKEFKTDMHST